MMMSYKFCAVPSCINNSKLYPHKLYIHVPPDPEIRTLWFAAAGYNKDFPTTNLHFCEDHFDLENTVLNLAEVRANPYKRKIINRKAMPVKLIKIEKDSTEEQKPRTRKSNPAILRKKIKITLDAERQNANNWKELEFVYYTGLRDYKFGLAVVNGIRFPSFLLSNEKLFMITLMKLRFDFEWADLCFRIKEDVVIRIFKDTIIVLFKALKAHVPDFMTSSNPTEMPITRMKSTQYFYAYNLKYEELNNELQVIVIFSPGPKPIVYISKSYQTSHMPIRIIIIECKNQLNMLPNDYIYCDREKQLYKVAEETPFYEKLPKPFYIPHPLQEMESIANQFKAFKYIQNLSNIMFPGKCLGTCAAIVNLNFLPIEEYSEALYRLRLASTSLD